VDERQRPAGAPRDGAAGVHERVPAGRGHLSLPAVSLRDARRLALHAQGLAASPPRGGAGPEAVAAVAERIGCLQLDPVSAVARSPLLVLFARLGPALREAALERAAYERRTLFDAWAHEASLVATADLPLHGWAMRTYLDAPTTRAARARAFLTANAAFCDELVAELRERGPLRARELEDRSAEPWRHGWWTDEVSGRQTIGRLLHLLWITGRIGVARRVAGERLWDVFERCLPAGAPAATLDDEAAERAAVLRAVRMLGVARPAHVRAHFLRRRYPRLAETLAALTAAGRLERVQVRALSGEWYAAPEDLERVPDLPPGARTIALSPFDNLLCDRARTAELFGFEHRLEIYVPPAKRRWGYYVLPILHRERLVARADAALDREAGLLRVHALYREPDVRRTPALERAIARALERLAVWRGARGVTSSIR
jgi:uncharacterized protein YcaQ